jgi:hypothetical protein
MPLSCAHPISTGDGALPELHFGGLYQMGEV